MSSKDGFHQDITESNSFRQAGEIFRKYYKDLLNEIYSYKDKASIELSRILEYIKANYADNITLVSVAKVACMNPYYFSTFFKKAIGVNFKSYLTNLRLEQAAYLLESTDYKLYEVANAVGYQSIQQFNAKFKEAYGIAAKDYMVQNKK